MSSSSSSVSLWINPEPFEFGIVPIPPPTKLVHHNLKKLFAYAKNKGKAGYPRISYAIWKHIACNKLQISEDVAWLYFQTCDTVTEHNCEFRLMVAEQYLTCKTDEEKAKWRERCSVDLLKFLIFLYMQHAHVISIKASLVVGEEWPSRSRSPELEGRAGVGAKTMNEHAQLQFVQNNLMEILELLVEPDAYSMGANGDSSLTLDALKALGLLISGTSGRDVVPVDELASRQSQAQSSGYSKISRTFSTKKLYKWITLNLKSNPFGVSGTISSGQRLRGRAYSVACEDSLSVSLSSSMGEELIRNNRASIDLRELQDSITNEIDLNTSIKLSQGPISNKIISNANFAPAGNHMMIFNQVCKRTVARAGDPLTKSRVKVHRCQYSHMYLLSPLRAISIEKCHGTKLFLGPVETVVNIIACENVEVCAVTRKININSCRNCVFHLFTETKPVLIGTNEDIFFAPYSTFYPALLQDMVTVGLTASYNFWNEPLLPGSEASTASKVWDELDADNFFRLCTPFDMEGDTKECPFRLPKKYEEALRKKEDQLDNWHKMVSEAKLTRDQKKQLQGMVQSRFQEWLKETGNQQLLESLTLQHR
ncbi:TBCC domain-containing protein 1-like [Rhopilema esculentum]|uniref:TBCC domain-containing protein 1-like n=1 Tax=Rhopilema esculentum TaxID=499914 RepID=UPI0031DC9EAE